MPRDPALDKQTDRAKRIISLSSNRNPLLFYAKRSRGVPGDFHPGFTGTEYISKTRTKSGLPRRSAGISGVYPSLGSVCVKSNPRSPHTVIQYSPSNPAGPLYCKIKTFCILVTQTLCFVNSSQVGHGSPPSVFIASVTFPYDRSLSSPPRRCRPRFIEHSCMAKACH